MSSGSLSGTTAFTFLVRYLPWQSAPAGAFVIHLGSRQTFIGTSLDWIVVDGARASFRGRGRLSSGGSYSYSGNMSGFAVWGGTSYTVSADENGGSMNGSGTGCVATPKGTFCRGGTEKYTLTPIEPCEE